MGHHTVQLLRQTPWYLRLKKLSGVHFWVIRFNPLSTKSDQHQFAPSNIHPEKGVKNRAARALTFSSYDADASQLFQNLNWKNLSTQRDIQKALMVFKSLNGLAPEYLSSKFISRSNITSYTFLDSVNKLTIPQPRTNYLRNSFRYSGAVRWNSLPETLRQAESLSN